MNIRKFTFHQTLSLANLNENDMNNDYSDGVISLRERALESICAVLNVTRSELLANTKRAPDVLVRQKSEIAATRRQISRDGIDFYNYYDLPAPRDHVAPVLLDILCPPERVPALNNGHREPAITVNLGPGSIMGRWGLSLEGDNCCLLSANLLHDRWITGDSYIEPAYCPHTYARADDHGARIISYTCRSNLAPLIDTSNTWGDDAFLQLSSGLTEACLQGKLLDAQLRRRGHSSASLAVSACVNASDLDAFLAGTGSELSTDELRRVARVLGLDYRVFLSPQRQWDSVGKVVCPVEQSRATVRRFQSYIVASIASATNLPDMCGFFMQVQKRHDEIEFDLWDAGAVHYYITSGLLRFRRSGGTVQSYDIELGSGDAVWVAPFVAHGFTGRGALIKLSGGEGYSYLDQIELSNSYHPQELLRRARRDEGNWGYDK